MNAETAHRRYIDAAIRLAVSVDIGDRLTDPSYPASRGPHADALRAQDAKDALAEYRAAAAAFEAVSA